MVESNNSVSEIYVNAALPLPLPTPLPLLLLAMRCVVRRKRLSTSPIAHQLQANKLLLMIENQILKYVYFICVAAAAAACQCDWLLLFTPYLGCILNAAARNCGTTFDRHCSGQPAGRPTNSCQHWLVARAAP